MNKLRTWVLDNIVAVILSVVFILFYIIRAIFPSLNTVFGACDYPYLNGQVYRYFSCIFLHYNLYNLIINIIGLLAISTLLSKFICKFKLLIIFIVTGILSEVIYGFFVSGNLSYGGGASGAIFGLIALFLVCYLRFPNSFNIKWYNIDSLIVIVYFIISNNSWSAALTHLSGFAIGIVLSFLLVILKVIKEPVSLDN